MVNSSRPALYLSFHGGTGAGNWNNIHAYDLEGSAIGKVLDKKSLPKKVNLRELRGFDLGPDSNPGLMHPFHLAFSPSGDLYVSAQDTNLVLRYRGPNATEGKPGEPMLVKTSLNNPSAR